MRLTVVVLFVLWVNVDGQFWKLPEELLSSFPWFRQPKTGESNNRTVTTTTTTVPTLSTILTSTGKRSSSSGTTLFKKASTVNSGITTKKILSTMQKATTVRTTPVKKNSTIQQRHSTISTQATTPQKNSTIAQLSTSTPKSTKFSSNPTTTINSKGTSTFRTTASVTQSVFISSTESSTLNVESSTTPDLQGTTIESRDNHRVHHFYMSKHEKPQMKIVSNISQNLLPLPADASAALVKPTKYHYYPHNQHIYLLPECAIQQVCNAVYVRLNWTQPLCACPSRYRDPCSASLNSDDQHTTELLTNNNQRKALTLVKTCEPTSEMRICRSPRDWSLLALQNIRTGKSHYLVICRCPESSFLDGPMSHNQPTYASVPGIRVYGMMCVQQSNRRDRSFKSFSSNDPKFPWQKAKDFAKTVHWD